MKQYFLLLAFLIIVPTRPAAQSNHPFPSGFAEWVVFEASSVAGPEDAYTVYRHFIDGDSIFNDQTYSKVYYQDLCACQFCINPTVYEPAPSQEIKLIGGVREEAGKVYFSNLGGVGNFTEYILFDFTLQPNDTFNSTFRVIAVDTTVDGRKQLHLENIEQHYPRTWVEGIGAYGLFTNNYYAWYHYNGSCFSTNITSSCAVPCTVTTAVIPSPDAGKTMIFPSIATDEVTVLFSNIYSRADLSVFSSDGQFIKAERNVASGDHIAVLDLPRGIYFFHLTLENGHSYVHRVVK